MNLIPCEQTLRIIPFSEILKIIMYGSLMLGTSSPKSCNRHLSLSSQTLSYHQHHVHHFARPSDQTLETHKHSSDIHHLYRQTHALALTHPLTTNLNQIFETRDCDFNSHLGLAPSLEFRSAPPTNHLIVDDTHAFCRKRSTLFIINRVYDSIIRRL